MARTIKDWYNVIIAEKESLDSLSNLGHENDNAQALLAELDSNSRVSVWRLWVWIAAFFGWLLESFFELFKQEVADKLRAKPGTEAWLAQESLKFQYGDLLQFNEDGSYGYDVTNEVNQIVKRVAVSSLFGKTIVKVAALVNNEPTELDGSQLTAFQGYLDAIKYAGTNVIASSAPSDKLWLQMTVYFNPLKPLDDLKPDVENAVTEYLASLNFAGQFRRSALIDSVQAVGFVTDVVIDHLQARQDGGGFQSIARIYDPVSGYIIVDQGLPLANNITYISE